MQRALENDRVEGAIDRKRRQNNAKNVGMVRGFVW
jgi:hypothetical protein